ncbi:MAG: CDP-glycerol glycerophosphotransferase (TagB/SpsB family) [Flavobacteriales bacterium]|jgi:CDP-glycerol glycerophosphotransferase (TagB/SpsB family)
MKIFNHFFFEKVIASFCLIFFQFLQLFVKKDNNLFLFFHSSTNLSDNNKYAFIELVKHSEYQCYNFIFKKELFKNISNNDKQYRPIYFFSLKACYLYLKSSTIFTTHDALFFPFGLNPKTKRIINLWHGTPLKTIGADTIKNSKNRKLRKLKYSHVLCNSDFEKILLSSSFNQPLNSFWLIGSPRHNAILKGNKLNDIHHFLNKKVILYAPTFRDNGKAVELFPFKNFELEKFDIFLKENNSVLLVRTHPSDRTSSEYFVKNAENIISANSEVFPDIQDLLFHTDLLITDYSSVYLDYLVLNRPMMILPYDIEKYKYERGLLFDIEKFFPGPSITDYKDFKNYINASLENPSIDADKRKFVSSVFHYHQDGNTMERLIEKLSEIN